MLYMIFECNIWVKNTTNGSLLSRSHKCVLCTVRVVSVNSRRIFSSTGSGANRRMPVCSPRDQYVCGIPIYLFRYWIIYSTYILYIRPCPSHLPVFIPNMLKNVQLCWKKTVLKCILFLSFGKQNMRILFPNKKMNKSSWCSLWSKLCTIMKKERKCRQNYILLTFSWNCLPAKSQSLL
jgi:hypothetical protein